MTDTTGRATMFRRGDLRMIVAFGLVIEVALFLAALMFEPHPATIAFIGTGCYILGFTATLGARLNKERDS